MKNLYALTFMMAIVPMVVALQIEAINDALDQLRDEKAKPRKPIGFKTNK